MVIPTPATARAQATFHQVRSTITTITTCAGASGDPHHSKRMLAAFTT